MTPLPKVDVTNGILKTFLDPPRSPDECIFSQVTACVSADLATQITPCQFGGRPVCTECGCMASAGLASIGRLRVAGSIPVASIYSFSQKLGDIVAAGKQSLGETQMRFDRVAPLPKSILKGSKD